MMHVVVNMYFVTNDMMYMLGFVLKLIVCKQKHILFSIKLLLMFIQ